MSVSSQHLEKKDPVLIRPLVLKLPIDFPGNVLWASSQLWLLAPAAAKLSHLEAGAVFRDSTPLHDYLFLSGGPSFFWSHNMFGLPRFYDSQKSTDTGRGKNWFSMF